VLYNEIFTLKLKKKQHYVSQFYLKQWSGCGKRVYAIINGKVVPMKTKEIASSNFFYKATNMTPATRNALLHGLSKLKSPLVQDLLTTAIQGVHLVERLSEKVDDKDEDFALAENLIRTNVIEDYYVIIEELATPDIKHLSESDGEQLTIEKYQNVLRFAVNQLSRTSAVKNKFKESSIELLRKNEIDFQTFNAFQTLIISEEVVLNLIEKLYKITLLENQSDVNFITSDNPAVNLNPITSQDIKLFLPLSPKKAIYIEPSGINGSAASTVKENYLSGVHAPRYYLKKDTVNEQDVHDLNKRIYGNRERHVFGFCPKDLENFLEA